MISHLFYVHIKLKCYCDTSLYHCPGWQFKRGTPNSKSGSLKKAVNCYFGSWILQRLLRSDEFCRKRL